MQGKVAPALVPLADARKGLISGHSTVAPRRNSCRGTRRSKRGALFGTRHLTRGAVFGRFDLTVDGIPGSSSSESDSGSESSEGPAAPLVDESPANVTNSTGNPGVENEGKRSEDISPLTDLECVMASPRVKGFDLTAKEWCRQKTSKDLPYTRLARQCLLIVLSNI